MYSDADALQRARSHLRILFVDDEPNILRALRRSLRGHLGKWDMEFVQDAAAAMDHMHANPVDVLVSDVSMPQVDGITLLTRVREHFPHTVRILLSGTIEGQVGSRAVPVAHQFIAKPWRAMELIDVLERASELRDLLQQSALQTIVGGIRALPTLPGIYYRLSAAVEDPDSSLEDIIDIVQQDSGIVARLLQLVNSAFLAPAHPISTAADAVRYLGSNMLRSLVLATEAFRLFEDRANSRSISLNTVQKHALQTAEVAMKIAPRNLRERVFAAAVLHDIGISVLAAEMPEAWQHISLEAKRSGRPVVEVEQEVLQVTHAEVGAYLLGIWGLPREIVETAAYHHQPSRISNPSFDVLGAVHIANSLVDEAMRVPCPIDECYVDAVGVRDKLEEWRILASGQK